MTGYIEERKLEDALAEYISKAKTMDIIDHETAALKELENIIDAFDKDIEEVEKIGLDETVEALCKVRNSLNLGRLELEVHTCKLKLWLAEFEKARQLTR